MHAPTAGARRSPFPAPAKSGYRATRGGGRGGGGAGACAGAAAGVGGGCGGAEIVDRSLRFVGGGVEMSVDFGAPADDPKVFRNICRDRTSTRALLISSLPHIFYSS